MEAKPRNWHRRQALAIAAQLPEETEDALEILRCAQQLILFSDQFEPEPEPIAPTDQSVLEFPKTPRRRASSSGRPSGLPK
ncbi:hypothetical protein E0F70_11635 [Streptococcus dysgalactiae]|nr:hypothetical protein E0F70_11635 [Streptococcus dysgalactiae]